MKTHRVFLVFAGLVFSGAGAVGLACSSTDNTTGGNDSGADGNANGDSGFADSGAPRDSGGNPGNDGGGGHCSPVEGACDLTLQDCPSTQECVVLLASDGGLTTGCQTTRATAQLPTGAGCCPTQDPSTDPCDRGLTCLGNMCTDGGAKTGRCSPSCCQNDNSICGSSTPEGIAGTCDVTILINSVPAYYACTYSETCTPFRVQPCKPGEACEINDQFGTANCSVLFDDAGAGEHAPCGNGCADGLMCFLKDIDGGDAGDECLYLCHVPLTATPFDAGLLNGNAGTGGCTGATAGETCQDVLDHTKSFPPYVGLCLP